MDLGLCGALVSGNAEVDLGRKLENLVYLELRRRNIGDIWVGKVDDSEVDFVVQNPAGEREYYQVAWTAYSSEIVERELKPFNRIKDHYQKFLITVDPDNTNYNGVRKINIIDWLTAECA